MNIRERAQNLPLPRHKSERRQLVSIVTVGEMMFDKAVSVECKTIESGVISEGVSSGVVMYADGDTFFVYGSCEMKGCHVYGDAFAIELRNGRYECVTNGRQVSKVSLDDPGFLVTGNGPITAESGKYEVHRGIFPTNLAKSGVTWIVWNEGHGTTGEQDRWELAERC